MENECILRKRKKNTAHKASKRLIFLSLIPISLILMFLFLSSNMRPAMTALATARIKSIAAKAMNNAILESMDDEAKYADLVESFENGQHVYMLNANTRNLNILAADCADKALEFIASMGEQGISVPLGTITGISFFSGRGPAIKVYFTPVGSVQSTFNSKFISSGINQTLYRVNLELKATVKLVMPSVSKTIEVTAQAAIAESIIVGDVPQVYTNVANEDDMLNLIPTEIP